MGKWNILLIFFAAQSCISVKKYNENLEKPVAAEKLKKDVDFAYNHLKKLHPELYLYIDKEKLDYKFDSLKSTITTPLISAQFYTKLAPVITDIRQGHLRLIPTEKKLTRKELKKLENQKGLFSRMNYVLDNNRIFVKDNADQFEGIKVGTEITKIDDVNASEYIERYKNLVNSDGYNTTFQKYSMARRWPVFLTIEKGILDSIKIQTRYQNVIKDCYIHREKVTKEEKKQEQKQITKIKKDPTQKSKDYNPVIRDYNRDLQFIGKDSSIAYMKIKTFSGTHSAKFYKQSFSQIKTKNVSILILDIRDNLGGSLWEINNLYSYLAKDHFPFIKDIEVTSRTSMFRADYISDFPGYLKPIGWLSYPIYTMGIALSTKENNGKMYLRNNNIFSIKKAKNNAFSGKIYVLINGSSFSAASILPAKLKGDKRAILVGEETGGTNDGTVAGRYSTEKLPNSKLYLPIGLMLIQPNIEFTQTKKGVLPDVEIVPTLDVILSKKDVQLKWIMDEIQKEL